MDPALARRGVIARCDRVAVATDLRQDWPAAVRGPGFDPSRNTTWLAEGILYALAPDAVDTLLERIAELSAPESALALDHIKDSLALSAARAAVSPELAALWQGGPSDLPGWLIKHGWKPTISELRWVAADYHRGVPAELAGAPTDASRAWLATATLPDAPTP